MKICGVYKITNPMGEVYIGQSANILDRWSAHRGMKNHFERLLKDSLKLHGVNNHVFEIIEICDKSVKKQRERFYQEQYFLNSVKMLNLVMAGKYGFQKRVHESTRALMGANIIKNHTGLKRSVESKENMREAAKGRRKIVLKYDLNMNFLAKYESASEAARQHPLLKYSHIKGVCNAHAKTHGGFIWKYAKVSIPLVPF